MNKKITLLLLAAVLTASSAMAQQLPKFGVQAGLNLSNYWGRDAPSATNKPGVILGLVLEDAEYGGKNFSLQGGILFVQQGAKIDLEELIGRKTNTEMTINYLQMPAYAQYNIELGNNMGLFLQGGVYLGYAISGKQKTGGESVKIDFKERNMARYDFGLGLGAGLKIMDNIQIGLSKNWGASSLVKKSDALFYNTNWALTATYLFGKKE